MIRYIANFNLNDILSWLRISGSVPLGQSLHLGCGLVHLRLLISSIYSVRKTSAHPPLSVNRASIFSQNLGPTSAFSDLTWSESLRNSMSTSGIFILERSLERIIWRLVAASRGGELFVDKR